MNQQVLREEKPACFGRIDEPAKQVEGWNPQCPSCAGGIDAAYTDKNTGSHIRERCQFFQPCGTTVQAKRMEQMRSSFIDPRTLIRPTVQQQVQQQPQVTQQQMPPAAAPLANYQAQNQQQLAASIQQQQAAALQQQQYNAMMQQMAQMQRMNPQMMPQQMMMAQQPMQMGYQQMMPVNYNMPAYLTTPEPMHEGGFWKMFATTVFRSVGKSVGHSVSYMFDAVPLGSPKPR